MSTPTKDTPNEDGPKEEPKNRPLAQSVRYQSPVLGEVSLGGPWERSYQKLAMFSCSLYFIMPTTAFAWAFTLYFIFDGIWQYQELKTYQTIMASLMAIYLTYVLLDKAPTNGSRTPYLRRFQDWWSHSCDYLPLLLVKTADLPPDHNYVLGYHPHGIISVGCFGAFATDGARVMDLSSSSNKDTSQDNNDDNLDDTNHKSDDFVPIQRGFSSLFPNLDRRVITLPQNFSTPFLREYFLAMGACTSARETFRNILAKPSTAVVVVVGGAAESMHAKAGGLDLVLETRRGFVREAIMANASLAPVIAFGENDLYKTYETDTKSKLGQFQAFVKKNFGFAMPIFAGRSIVFLNFGVMPQRKPVIVVVGAPIPPPKLKGDCKNFAPKVDRKTDQAMNEDGEILKKHHATYIQALEELYNKYKNASWNSPGQSRRASMRIIKK